MKLVCMGDSLTYGYAIFRKDCWVHLLENELNIEIINVGINGDTTAGMLSRSYEDIVQNTPTHVIIMGGTNDFISNRPLHLVEENIKQLVNEAIENKIVPIIGIEPPIDRILAERKWTDAVDYDKINLILCEYRKWIINFSDKKNINYIDFHNKFIEELKDKDPRELYVDGLHPTPYGHELMAKCVINLFKKVL
ncbi:GDSL-type esterase/lipase family protein [Clostridium thailandense]|uniref:Hydrolase n=1 Tax=Clostridium thailandense TaxID=2794346 RepID=A0A949TPG2_9CLOT|nr:GDSL-type esterase/lipase family protein [Clostridium thailandense]MBV7272997.1 hydrolase [Clostridium thailandense]MCH5135661.1 hydrolase [Clostridiaceae bacterium UIB06]